MVQNQPSTKYLYGRPILGCLMLSPTGDPLQNPNPKWVSNTIPIAFNRVLIYQTHFGCRKRHNLNLSILSPEDPFAERVFLLSEKTKNRRYLKDECILYFGSRLLEIVLQILSLFSSLYYPSLSSCLQTKKLLTKSRKENRCVVIMISI